jgi:hypothetical protein
LPHAGRFALLAWTRAWAIARSLGSTPPHAIAFVGADASFAARVLRHLPRPLQPRFATLVGTRASPEILAPGWSLRPLERSPGDWLADAQAPRVDALVAIDFLGGFRGEELAAVLDRVARRARLFVACDRRGTFRAGELARLWPEWDSCVLEDRSGGPFATLFVARRL